MNLNQNLNNKTLIIASGNKGKIKEFRELLSFFPLDIQPQPNGLEVDEIGKNFIENARIKALEVSLFTKEWTLADDSGLSVEALNGEPGLYSARYAKTDLLRINKLLKNLEPYKNRKAKFIAALCLASKGNVLIEVQGTCHGLITHSPRGSEGFGYDPIFEVMNLGLTFAEMGSERKKLIGHRGLACQLLIPRLKKLLKIR